MNALVGDSRQLTLMPHLGDADAAEIGRLYRLARTSLVDSAVYSIQCGKMLATKKDSLKHGQWLPWLEHNTQILGFETRRTASRLLALAANGTPASHLDEATAITFSRKLWGHDLVRGTQGTGENEWYTPAGIIDAARSVLGGIDVDPASSEHAQKTVQALRYFTLQDDGLVQDWRGTVWLNPPYAQPHIENFADKMIEEIRALHVTSAIMLTHNYTDTAWFHKLAAGADAICFTKGRIRFESPDGTLAAPTQGQAFFYFGNQTARFLQMFTPLGFVVGALIT